MADLIGGGRVEMAQTTTIDAAYDKEFELILDKLGVLTEVREGKEHCAFCVKQVTLENIHGVFSKDGSIYVVCDRLPCHTKLVAESESHVAR
jgi:hypothetical protein